MISGAISFTISRMVSTTELESPLISLRRVLSINFSTAWEICSPMTRFSASLAREGVGAAVPGAGAVGLFSSGHRLRDKADRLLMVSAIRSGGVAGRVAVGSRSQLSRLSPLAAPAVGTPAVGKPATGAPNSERNVPLNSSGDAIGEFPSTMLDSWSCSFNISIS